VATATETRGSAIGGLGVVEARRRVVAPGHAATAQDDHVLLAISVEVGVEELALVVLALELRGLAQHRDVDRLGDGFASVTKSAP